MELTRRGVIALGAAAASVALLPARPASAAVEDAIAAFTGGATPVAGGLTLDIPEIAENGGSVPVTVSAPGATAITLIATANPNPGIGTFAFGPLAGSQSASTRIRLATSQDVIAIARMADGTYAEARRNVKVTVGGCSA